MSRNDSIEICLEIFHETENAYLVGESEEPDERVWIPKSLAEPDTDDPGKGDTAIFTMPEWLALDKGFI